MYRPLAVALLIATLVWAMGLPFGIGSAHAASLSSVSDTLSDSRPAVVANHTITFTTPTGIAAGQSITITFPASFNLATSSVAFGDVDLNINGVDQTLGATASGATWGATVTGSVLTILSSSATAGAGQVVIIKIGTNATVGGTGTHQITNPTPSNQSYVISIGGTMVDSASLRVAIVDAVTVTASIDTSLTFTVAGKTSGAVNSDAVTCGAGATATALPFGTVTPGTPLVLCQTLSVTTNAKNGFVVTVQENQPLTSSAGAIINLFKDGATTSTPVVWAAPAGTLGSPNTYGHIGVTSDDADEGGAEFTGTKYAGNFDTARAIFSNNGPADGSTANKGQANVAYKIQVSALQPAGTDYSNRLMYIATPTF